MEEARRIIDGLYEIKITHITLLNERIIRSETQKRLHGIIQDLISDAYGIQSDIDRLNDEIRILDEKLNKPKCS